MLKAIIRVFRAPVTAASITASLTKQVEKLNALAEEKRDDIQKMELQIEALEDAADEAAEEAFKAATIAARISALTDV